MKSKIEAFMQEVEARNGHEPEFMQAVQEVAETVIPYIITQDIYHGKNILMRMVEPERAVTFRVAWVDDDGEIQVNRGYRIQMNSAIGPYKGGLRFHPSVNQSILKFINSVVGAGQWLGQQFSGVGNDTTDRGHSVIAMETVRKLLTKLIERFLTDLINDFLVAENNCHVLEQ